MFLLCYLIAFTIYRDLTDEISEICFRVYNFLCIAAVVLLLFFFVNICNEVLHQP